MGDGVGVDPMVMGGVGRVGHAAERRFRNRFSSACPAACSGCFFHKQVLCNQNFGDLNSVQGGTLAEVVGDTPERQAVWHGVVDADPADIDRILPLRFRRRDIAAILAMVMQDNARGVAQGRTRLVDGDWMFEFDVHGLGMADEDRNPNAGSDDIDGGVEDFFGLDGHFPLFLGGAIIHEHIDLRDDVEGDVFLEDLRRILVMHVMDFGVGEQLVHALLAGAGDRLVGGNDNAFDLEFIVQWLQRHNQLNGGAVRVGDDVALGEFFDRLRIYLRHHQGDVGFHAELAGIVDDDAAGGGGAWRVDSRDRCTRGKQRDVPTGEIKFLQTFDREDAVFAKRDLAARGPAGGQGCHLGYRKVGVPTGF